MGQCVTEGGQVGVGGPPVSEDVGALLDPPLDDLQQGDLVPLVVSADLQETLGRLPGCENT